MQQQSNYHLLTRNDMSNIHARKPNKIGISVAMLCVLNPIWTIKRHLPDFHVYQWQYRSAMRRHQVRGDHWLQHHGRSSNHIAWMVESTEFCLFIFVVCRAQRQMRCIATTLVSFLCRQSIQRRNATSAKIDSPFLQQTAATVCVLLSLTNTAATRFLFCAVAATVFITSRVQATHFACL